VFKTKNDQRRFGAYGVYRQHDGTAERALFVIDSEGIIRRSYVSPVGVVPEADGILTALQTLTAKEKTP
jgi:alkyl hydroperoxide reductase subunit AhpC